MVGSIQDFPKLSHVKNQDGRKNVQMKIYLNAPSNVCNDLVITIQKSCKKLNLTQTDTMAKLNDVVRSEMDQYVVKPPSIRSEVGFVEKFKGQEKKIWKSKLLLDISGMILNDDSNQMFEYYQPPYAKTTHPIKDSNMLKCIIKPLMCGDLLATDLDDSSVYMRDQERDNIHIILDSLFDYAIKDNWVNFPSTTAAIEAQIRAFFQQASMFVWMDVLQTLLTVAISAPSGGGTIFHQNWSADDEKHARKCVKSIFSNPIWGTNDKDILALMNANKGGELQSKIQGVFSMATCYKTMQKY